MAPATRKGKEKAPNQDEDENVPQSIADITKRLSQISDSLTAQPTPADQQQFMVLLLQLLKLKCVPYSALKALQKFHKTYSPHDIPYSLVCRSFNGKDGPLLASEEGDDIPRRNDDFLNSFIFPYFEKTRDTLREFAYDGHQPKNEREMDGMFNAVR